MSLINRLLPSLSNVTKRVSSSGAASAGKSSARGFGLGKLANYGLDQYAANALSKKLGQPDGIIEKALHFLRPDLYNAYKTAKLAAPKAGPLRYGLMLIGLKFPLRMTAFMLAKQSGKGIGLMEWASILFSPRLSIAANAARNDVYAGVKKAGEGASTNLLDTAKQVVDDGIKSLSGGQGNAKGGFWNSLKSAAGNILDDVLKNANTQAKNGNNTLAVG